MPRRMARDPRLIEALRRAINGESYDVIAHATGVTAATAAADVRDALRAVQALLAADEDATDLLRVLELQRLDQLTEHCIRLLDEAKADGDRLDQLRAVDRALRVSYRRDKLLGLSDQAELPPSPEADEVDELKLRREDRMLKRAGSA